MILYIYIYFFIFSFSLFQFHISEKANDFFWKFILVLLIILTAIKYQVGGDFWAYYDLALIAKDEKLINSLFITEPAFMLVTWVSAQLGFELIGVQLFSGIIFFYGFNKVINKTHYKWLSLLIVLPFIFFVVVQGYLRQGISISFFLIALSYLMERKKLYFVLFIIIGFLFHRACIFQIILLISVINFQNIYDYFYKINVIINYMLMISIVLVIYFLFIYFVSIYKDDLISYLGEDMYTSQGAIPRGIINSISAFFYLYFFKHFKIYNDNWIFVNISIISLFLFFLTPFFSTFADRMTYYFSIIQVIFFSRFIFSLPDQNIRGIFYILIGILYFILLLIYLIYAKNSNQLYPYKIYGMEDRPQDCQLFSYKDEFYDGKKFEVYFEKGCSFTYYYE